MRRLTQACRVLVLLGLAGLLGCNQPPKKMQFNNMIARTNADLKGKAVAFYKVVVPLSKGEQVTPASARSSLGDVEKTLAEARKKFDSLKPPVNSPKGEAMLEKYRTFLKVEQDIVDGCFKPAVTAIEDNQNYPTPNAKWGAIRTLLEKADAIERDSYRALAAAQKDYVDAHKFKMVR